MPQGALLQFVKCDYNMCECGVYMWGVFRGVFRVSGVPWQKGPKGTRRPPAPGPNSDPNSSIPTPQPCHKCVVQCVFVQCI